MSLRGWTVHLVRTDGLESHTLQFRRSRLIGAIAVISLLLLGGGIALGYYGASRAESETVAALRARVADLSADRRRVGELAAALEAMEERYARLREAVTAGAPEAADLPPIPVETGLAARRGSESGAPAWPLTRGGFITRTFGSRTETSREGHTGLDIAVPTGSYVRAIRAGLVEAAGEDPVYGKFVRIAHADGLTSLYGHNSWLFAAAGDSVDRLQVIALSGNTGRSTAPHLHLELREDGVLVDPERYVSQEPSRARLTASVDTQER